MGKDWIGEKMKKGFTLIELLAVVAIIGIIGVITATVVTDNIENTKKKSFEVSAIHLLDASKEYVAKNMENHDFPSDGIAATTEELEIDNNPFISGIIKRNKNGQIVLIDVTDGRYCANGVKSNLEITRGDCSSQDETPPEVKVKVLEVGTTSAKVSISMQDSGSGIEKYTYRLRVGKNEQCNEIKKNNEKNILKEVINLNNLKIKTKYKLSVEVKNSLEDEKINKTIKNIKFETKEIEKPEFKISTTTYATIKELTIIYPEVNLREGYEYKFKKMPDDIFNTANIIIENNVIKMEIKEETKVIAYVEKDGKVIVENSIIVDGIDNNPPIVNVTVSDIDEWTTSKTVTINAVDEEVGMALKPYTYDNGSNWIRDNEKTYTSSGKLNIKVRDRLGNISDKFILNGTECRFINNECEINNIDSVAPSIEFEVYGMQIGNTEYYTSHNYKSGVSVAIKIEDYYLYNDKKVVGGSGVKNVDISVNGVLVSNPTKTSEGTYLVSLGRNRTINTISVSAEDRAGNSSANSIVVKIDDITPSISVKKNPLGLNKDPYNFTSNLSVAYGPTGGSVKCNPPASLTTGSYEVTCTATGNNGKTASTSFNVKHGYKAKKETVAVCKESYKYQNCQGYFEPDTGGNTVSCYCPGYGHSIRVSERDLNKAIRELVGKCCAGDIYDEAEKKKAYNYEDKYTCPNGGTLNKKEKMCYY